MTLEWDSPRSLTYVSGKCEESKEFTWGINFYYKNTMSKGKASFNIFSKDKSKGSAPVVSIPLEVAKLHEMRVCWKRLLNNYEPNAIVQLSLTESKWDKNEKAYKTIQIGNLAYGFDKDGNPKIALRHEKMTYGCLLEESSLFDRSVQRKEDFTPEVKREVLIEGIIMILKRAINDIFETQSYPHLPYDASAKKGSSSHTDDDNIPF